MQQGIAAGASLFEVIDAPGEPQGGTRRLQRAHGEVEFRARELRVRDGERRGAAPHRLHGPGRHHRRDRRALGQRQVDAGVAAAALLRSDHRQRAARRGGHSATIGSRTCARRSASSARRWCCSTTRIRNNILFGAEGIGEAQLLAAARAAYVMEFVEQLPAGARDHGWGSRRAAVGRPAPAHRDCTRAAARYADPDSR